MSKISFPKTELLLKEIQAFRERELLVECWEIFWRKWDTRLINEYFMDNHINELESRINRISGYFYNDSKNEILSFITAANGESNKIRKLKTWLFEKFQDLKSKFSEEALINHISELNKNAPKRISGRFDSKDEEEWIETNKPEILDPFFIKELIVLLKPTMISLENLILIVSLSDKDDGVKELDIILSRSKIIDNLEEILADLLKSKEDIKIIDEWLLKGEFVELADNSSSCKYHWLGVNRNEEMGIVSSVNSSSVEQEEDKKVRAFSEIYQLAGLAFWLFENKKFNLPNYKASRIGRAVLNYYNWPITESNIKAFQSSNSDNLFQYSIYFEELKTKLKR